MRNFIYTRLTKLPLIALLLFAVLLPLNGQRHRTKDQGTSSSARTSPCYDANDPRDIRLWPGTAPGAIGNDPCRDIPFLQVYRPHGLQQKTASRREDDRAIIVIPGGGYDRLSDEKEQAPVAEYFSGQLGITTFILYYRLVQPDGTYRYPVPMWDGQRAIRLVRSMAIEFGINPQRVGLFGFSAGGHLASTIALHPDYDFGLSPNDRVDHSDAAPNFLGLGYPVISMLPEQYAPESSFHHLLHGYAGPELHRLEIFLSGQDNVSRHAPPVFLFESMDDQRISPQNSVLFADALRRAGVPSDVHLFQHGIHGAGLAQGIPEEEEWPSMFARWVQQF
jgi:acetyl esterase/lipase